MFQVGERVFCPLRGAGIVEAIENRSMMDEVKEYIIIKLKSSNMTIMTPTNRMGDSKFRHISDEETADRVLESLHEAMEIDASIPLKQRMKDNKAKLSAGTLSDYADVVKELTSIQKEKNLNATENSILMDARKYFVDEISMIKELSLEDANALVDEMLSTME